MPYCFTSLCTSDIMAGILYICLSICALTGWSHGVSTKMDFEEDQESVAFTNSTKVDDEDVEVKHTIVVSTKLKNANRRGLHNHNHGGTGVHTHHDGGKETKEDSGEVPIINGYKSVESTLIRTPDTRYKNKQGPQMFPDSVFINRNINDEYDIYPNYVNNPTQWKPSTFYHNINWVNQEVPISSERNPGFKNTLNRRPAYQIPGKYHRRITDDGIKEFYCSRCRELQGIADCGQSRSDTRSYIRNTYETTTPKLKLDGKLAKLN